MVIKCSAISEAHAHIEIASTWKKCYFNLMYGARNRTLQKIAICRSRTLLRRFRNFEQSKLHSDVLTSKFTPAILVKYFGVRSLPNSRCPQKSIVMVIIWNLNSMRKLAWWLRDWMTKFGRFACLAYTDYEVQQNN